jgi:thiamine-phosphate pyrophosphorylase
MTAPVIAGLYVISTPPERGESLNNWLHRCEAALRGGAAVFQYRDKNAPAEVRQQRASALLERCRAWKVPLIINDDWQLAKHIGAAGVHLGQNDGSVQTARQLLGPEAIIGASCYNKLAAAHQAIAHGASYVAFGSAFPSATKPQAPRASLSLYARAVQELSVPVVAIGGITAANAGQLAAAGVDAIAVISAIMQAANPTQAAREIRGAFLHTPVAKA